MLHCRNSVMQAILAGSRNRGSRTGTADLPSAEPRKNAPDDLVSPDKESQDIKWGGGKERT